jgi:hypothetical protein
MREMVRLRACQGMVPREDSESKVTDVLSSKFIITKRRGEVKMRGKGKKYPYEYT